MLQQIDLRELSEIHGNGRDVLSVYFRGSDGLSQLQNRISIVRDLLQDDSLELENFEKSLANIESLLEEERVDKAAGVCIFASEVLDLIRGYPISIEVPNRLIVGPAPFIRPLAELQDEYETFLIVAADNDRTRLITVTNETAEVEAAVKGGIKNHVRKGGWSQQRYERRRDEQLGHYGDDIVEKIDALVREHGIHRIVLIGSDETVRIIDQALPQTCADLVVGRESFDLHRPDDQLVEAAYKSYFADERESERDLWETIRGETLSDGRGCTGPADTLSAAKIGRVDTAIATRDIRIKATKCRDCEDVVANPTDTCPSCHSHNVFPIDYLDALARHLELTSAKLDFVDEIESLSKVGHVGALLRY
jgi:peptide chain release factor subunit 1